MAEESYEFIDNGVKMYLVLDKISERFSDPCVAVERHKQGSHHMTYIVTLESGIKRLVRVSYPFLRDYGSGIVPPSKMKSEVATMKYVREHTRIPVPEVLHYDGDEDGSVGAEWMVLEFINGLSLYHLWPDMSCDSRRAVAHSLANVFHQLLALRFNNIGSLQENEGGEISVGPMTFMPSNNTHHTAPPDSTKCGPFVSIKQWILALATGDLDFETSDTDTSEGSERRAAVVQDIQATTVFDDESLQDFCAIALEHVDLKLNNILVDPNDHTAIVGVIDWEGARTVPLFAIQPRWYLGIQHATSDEKNEMQVYTRAAVRSLDPVWFAATDDQGRSLREVLHRAMYSRWDPVVFSFEGTDVYQRGIPPAGTDP
ncbi:kinase-like protein [Gloeophyllum trabeum ATCC 11539]|uniref:Kinase-like protein n=1 Tax=Gloeophyllum trabeum (strain ATCC 11539 / FP-39264 / Madison 617) TaxID=670483 RepID=S7RHT3_GLOTA|nr:kinase-like protein [Gloeophyllum trabeum ATCC 11539]EPQ52154.1 kinase-like protein [Gloeophyllum trabeum ATCC 11539]